MVNNSLKQLMRLPLIHLVRSSHRTAVVLDVCNPNRARITSIKSDEVHQTVSQFLVHAERAAQWLCRAQDTSLDGGVSQGYSLRHGWMPSYPETTGYILPTFLSFGRHCKQDTYRERAYRMAQWLLHIQQPSGSFAGLHISSNAPPAVFNTGQILFGLIHAANEFQHDGFLQAASKAADWLVSVQDTDGAWRTFAYNAIPHAYYSRVSCALLLLHKRLGVESYLTAAIKNLEWTLKQQQSNGWFEHNSFTHSQHPTTHTIAYAADGLLNSGILLKNDTYIKAAQRTIDALTRVIQYYGYLPAELNNEWKAMATYTCVTGNAQTAQLLLRLCFLKQKTHYAGLAMELIQSVQRVQNSTSSASELYGALPGSAPIWGAYQPYFYINWAAKFFIDAVLSAAQYYNPDTAIPLSFSSFS